MERAAGEAMQRTAEPARPRVARRAALRRAALALATMLGAASAFSRPKPRPPLVIRQDAVDGGVERAGPEPA